MSEPLAAGPTIIVGRRGPGGPVMIAVVAVAVVAIAVGATITLSGDPDGSTPGAQPPATSSQVEFEPSGGVQPADPATKLPNPDMPLGPDGLPLVDGLVTSGPRYEQGARLLAELIAVVPAGFTVPATDSTPLRPGADEERDPADGDPFARTHQTMFMEKVAGVEVWLYSASLAVSAGPNTGMVGVTLTTQGMVRPEEDVCAQAATVPGMACELVDIDGREVMVLDLAAGDTVGAAQRAEYTHPDGTVMSVLHVQDSAGDGQHALPTPVFTPRQLAALAADDRFRVV